MRNKEDPHKIAQAERIYNYYRLREIILLNEWVEKGESEATKMIPTVQHRRAKAAKLLNIRLM